MKKIVAVLVLILLGISASTLIVSANEANYLDEANYEDIKATMEIIIGEQVESIDTSEWDEFLKDIQQMEGAIGENKSAREIIMELITGNYTMDTGAIIKGIFNTFFSEIIYNLGLMAKIIAVAIVCGILNNMKTSFQSSSVGEISHFVCYIVVILIIIQSLLYILKVGKEGIEQMVRFMQILFPILIAMLAAIGSITSTSIMKPAIALLVGVVSTFIKNTMLPLILFSSIITLINNISGKVNIKNLGKLVNNICAWTLGGVFTIFIAVMSIQGVMAATFDGISVRTAKFALESFVPIVGGMFSQSVDTVIGCSLLVKNAVGITGLIIIALICITPSLKILGLLVIYKLSSAMLEPIADPRITECLNGIGTVLTILFITVMGTALMFFITITLIINTGHVSVMLR